MYLSSASVRQQHTLGALLKAAVLLFLLLAVTADLAAAEETVRIGGTGGGLEAMRQLVNGYKRSHHAPVFKVLPSLGSSGGIKAVLAGAIDIGLSSRRLQEGEQGIQALAYGMTPFVFAISKKNPATGLTLKELEEIYTGQHPLWPDGRPLRLVLRPAAENDTVLLRSMSPGMGRAISAALIREGLIMAVTDQDNADAIEKIPGALGTTTLAQILSEKRPFKVLALNGVKPGLDTLTDRSYPYFKSYYLVTKKAPSPAVRAFIEFVFSAQGREILARSGYRAIGR